MRYYDEDFEPIFKRINKRLCNIDQIISGLTGSGYKFIVDNYTELQGVTPTTGDFAYVKNSQGTAWLPGSLGGTYYAKGIYYYLGSEWTYVGEFPINATQLEVSTGVVSDKFVTPNTLANSTQWNTKANTVHSHIIGDVTGLQTAINSKQDTLVNEVNIKSLNGSNLIGSGSIFNWNYLVANWSVAPTINMTIAGGDVYNYTLSGTTRYRFVPTVYDSTQDSFYGGFDGVSLSNIIVSRG